MSGIDRRNLNNYLLEAINRYNSERISKGPNGPKDDILMGKVHALSDVKNYINDCSENKEAGKVANGLKCPKCGGGLELSIGFDGLEEKEYDVRLDCRECPRVYPIARTTKQAHTQIEAVEPYKWEGD